MVRDTWGYTCWYCSKQEYAPSLPFIVCSSLSVLGAITPVLDVDTDHWPVDQWVTGSISVDAVTPSAFTVTLSGAGLTFVPSIFTFQSSSGITTQNFQVKATSLGSSRIYYTIGGTDISYVDPFPSKSITVVSSM